MPAITHATASSGVDPHDRLWLLDAYRRQAATNEWIDELSLMMLKWEPIHVWLEEGGVIQKATDPVIRKTLADRRIFVYREALTSIADKEARAISIRGHIANTGLHVVKGSPWWPAFRSEMLSFPTGRYDDQVDAISLVGRAIHRLIKGNEPRHDPRPWRGERVAVRNGNIPMHLWPLDEPRGNVVALGPRRIR
jgi:predicted phage terminase large subunit-like protein